MSNKIANLRTHCGSWPVHVPLPVPASPVVQLLSSSPSRKKPSLHTYIAMVHKASLSSIYSIDPFGMDDNSGHCTSMEIKYNNYAHVTIEAREWLHLERDIKK